MELHLLSGRKQYRSYSFIAKRAWGKSNVFYLGLDCGALSRDGKAACYGGSRTGESWMGPSPGLGTEPWRIQGGHRPQQGAAGGYFRATRARLSCAEFLHRTSE